MWVCDNEDHVKEMIEYYKPKLGISDWAITHVVKPEINVPNQGVASSHWILSRRVAWVTLSHSESRHDGAMPDDAEISLVHELLHVALGAWHDFTEPQMGTRNIHFDMCCEQPIDQLAETLVLFRRSSGYKFSFEVEE